MPIRKPLLAIITAIAAVPAMAQSDLPDTPEQHRLECKIRGQFAAGLLENRIKGDTEAETRRSTASAPDDNPFLGDVDEIVDRVYRYDAARVDAPASLAEEVTADCLRSL